MRRVGFVTDGRMGMHQGHCCARDELGVRLIAW
jgi:hypothetical protein